MDSVADVVRNHLNNYIYIATGVPDNGISLTYSPNWTNTNPIYSFGIFRSINLWEPINEWLIEEFIENGSKKHRSTMKTGLDILS